jgi:hypothetical protein
MMTAVGKIDGIQIQAIDLEEIRKEMEENIQYLIQQKATFPQLSE